MTNMTDQSPVPAQDRRWPIWPLGITIFLILFVLSLVGFWIYASRQDVQLVTKNYYEKELKYQEQIDREHRANVLVEPVKMTYSATNRQYAIQFPDVFPAAAVGGELVFYRPSDARADSHHKIQLDENRQQSFTTATMAKGLWRVNLTWKVDGLEYFNEGSFVLQ